MSEFTDRVDSYLKGLTGVSHGPCPGCSECKETYDFATQEECDEAISSGQLPTEPHFSSAPCDVCSSHLGGDRYVWHYVDNNDEVEHEYNICTDCVNYITNGEKPEGEVLP